MTFQETVTSLGNDAEALETLYQQAQSRGDAQAFKEAIDAGHHAAPDNLLYAAWYYRLKEGAEQVKEFAVAWAWVVPLALINGLLFWWLSDDQAFMVTIHGFEGYEQDFLPVLFLLAAPVTAAVVLVYLTAVGRGRWRLSVAIALLLLAAAAYVLLIYPRLGIIPFQEQYLTLMAIHLPLLAWAGVGAFLIAEHRDAHSRFALLIKSFELFIAGGLFMAAVGVFTGITAGLFDALDVNFPETVQRLFIAGGGGMILVLATAVIYNPALPPGEQSFDEGISKLLALLMRILLPFSLLVLLVYLLFIPFNFRAPFDNRDVLIIYNAMLFAVVLLLAGATPVGAGSISPRSAPWLRRGIMALAILALLVSFYALAAILYRTALDRLTPNRLAFIGWNLINVGLLLLVLILQIRAKKGEWLGRIQRAFSMGTVAYAAWTIAVILLLPWFFGGQAKTAEGLPVSVQRIVYQYPQPILLKCQTSPHIYLLEQGQKRWIDTIETFEARGYEWRDVHFVSCPVLRQVPDGETIPPNVGSPPQP